MKLQWERLDDEGDYWRAKAPLFGSIRIERRIKDWAVEWSVPGFSALLLTGLFNTTDKAKAAAQDYVDAALSGGETAALRDVIAERKRQVSEEGWAPEHDDEHHECELARAAATYAVCTRPGQLTVNGAICWPWSRNWWKPQSYRRNLVKAGALLLAEIERLDRATQPEPAAEEDRA